MTLVYVMVDDQVIRTVRPAPHEKKQGTVAAQMAEATEIAKQDVAKWQSSDQFVGRKLWVRIGEK